VCACRSKTVVAEDKLLLAASVICAASYLVDQSTTDRVRCTTAFIVIVRPISSL